MTAGTIAPPMMDMTSNADPSLVYIPRFFTLRAKMVGNMMESKKPSSTTAHTGAAPDPAIAVKVHRKAQTAKTPSSRGVLGKANHKAGHADLRSHIKKLRDDALNQMLVSPNLPALPRSVLRLK